MSPAELIQVIVAVSISALLLYVTWKNAQYCNRVESSVMMFLRMEKKLDETLSKIEIVPKMFQDLEILKSAFESRMRHADDVETSNIKDIRRSSTKRDE